MTLAFDRRVIVPDLLVGLTVAAVAIPEALGYSTIAGTPLVNGLYTNLLPLLLFAILGLSRRMVIGADSATASIVFAGLIGLGALGLTPGSQVWAETAAAVAVVTGVIVVGIRLSGLGFLADFLSQTVLLGFLAGVGVQVALRQIPDLLGVDVPRSSFVNDVLATVRAIPDTNVTTLGVGLCTIVVMLVAARVSERIPGALVALVLATAVVSLAGLQSNGVSVVGPIPGGLPVVALPSVPNGAWPDVLQISAICALVILAQGVATARAFQEKDEVAGVDRDLLGLGVANIAGGLTGAFPVNGSPTKTEVSVASGGRSQWVGVVMALVTVVVLVAATGAVSNLPRAALAGVVFVIGLRLVNLRSLRRVARLKRTEFGIALGTATAVIVIGVGAGIAVAIGVSILAHLRRGYRPHNVVMVKTDGEWAGHPVTSGARSEPGLVIYRFNGEIYFANARRLAADVELLLEPAADGVPLRWFVLDAGAVVEIDYSAALVVADLFANLHSRGIEICVAELQPGLPEAFQRYGLLDAVSPDRVFATFPSARRAYLHRATDG